MFALDLAGVTFIKNMLNKIKFLVEKIKDWLPKAQSQIKAHAAEIEAKIKQENLNPLPQSQIKTLSHEINRLPIPQTYRDAIQSKLTEAIAQWQEQEDAANSLVILGSPVEPLSKILNEALADWEQQHFWTIKILSWSERPSNYVTIKSQLLQEMGWTQDNHQQSEKSRVLMVIPDLSLCFLRCIDGLDGIEYLQDLLLNNRSQFWLIGCNEWAWQYFNIICQLEAYFDHTFSLPPLEDLELKQWLTPISKMIKFNFLNGKNNQNQGSQLKDDNEENWSSSSEQDYFQKLEVISQGLSSVAAKLWLLSFRIQEEKDEEEKNNDELTSANKSEPEIKENIVLKLPNLNNLPELTKNEFYILFSLGLHGELTLSELALSLGEPKNTVQNQVQVLRQLGLLNFNNNRLRLNPVYYLQLKKDLVNNYFLTEGAK